MPKPVIDAADLAAKLASTNPPLVLDVRWKLGGASAYPEYLAAHIPGALFVDLEQDLSGPPGDGGRHPLPDLAELQIALRAAGVTAGREIVVYDFGDAMAAARAWWTLRWAGHPRVQVLDGGFPAWVASGEPTTDSPSVVEPGDFEVQPGGMPMLDAASAASLAQSADGVLLDARVPERFRGETEPIDAVAGHIPGALNLPYGKLVNADGTLRKDLVSVLPAAINVGAYCGSGITAAHTVLALHQAGHEEAALYVGSWSEWITDKDRPIATGPAS